MIFFKNESNNVKENIQKYYEKNRTDIWIIFLLISFTYLISKFAWAIISGDYGTYIPISDMKEFYMQSTGIGEVRAPWKYRILTPLIVSLLPMDPILGFYIFNLGVTFIGTIIYYLFFKELGFSQQTSALGVTIFIVSHVVLFNFFLPMADALTHLLIIMSFYLTKKGKINFIPIIVLIGVLNHESIIFIILLYLQFEKNKIKGLLISSLPFIEVLFVRLILGYENTVSLYVIEFLINNWLVVILFILQTYLFFWLGIKNLFKIEFIKKSSIVIVGVIPLLFLAQHTARMLFLLHPIIIPSFLYEIEKPLNQDIDEIPIKP